MRKVDLDWGCGLGKAAFAEAAYSVGGIDTESTVGCWLISCSYAYSFPLHHTALPPTSFNTQGKHSQPKTRQRMQLLGGERYPEEDSGACREWSVKRTTVRSLLMGSAAVARKRWMSRASSIRQARPAQAAGASDGRGRGDSTAVTASLSSSTRDLSKRPNRLVPSSAWFLAGTAQ